VSHLRCVCWLVYLLTLLYRRKESEKAAKKRKVAAPKRPAKKSKPSDDDDGVSGRRESVRDRDKNSAKNKKKAALAALKKERKLQRQQREESSDDSELDFGDDDDESDEDYDEEKPWQKASKAKSSVSRLDKRTADDSDEEEEKTKPLQQQQSVADVDAGWNDFLKVTIPRRRLARWCNEPFFTPAVLECFVRLFIGEDNQGEKVYRLCEIIDVKSTDKSYKFPVSKKSDTPVATNKVVRLKFGNSERDFPMSLISDADPTEMDVQKYITTQKNHRLHILTRREANRLRRMRDQLVQNYTYTTEDIEKNMARRREQGKAAGNLGLEQTKAAIAVQAARENVQDAERRVNEAKRALMEADSNVDEASLTEAVKEAERALQQFKDDLERKLKDEQATKEAVQNRKRRLTRRSKDRDWAKVNERALQANQRSDRTSNKSPVQDAASKNKKKEFNLYARRRVKPKILWEVGQKDDDDKDDAEPGTEADAKEKKEDAILETFVRNPKTVIPKVADAQAAMLDSLLGGLRKKEPPKNRVRKGISLNEYLERKERGEL